MAGSTMLPTQVYGVEATAQSQSSVGTGESNAQRELDEAKSKIEQLESQVKELQRSIAEIQADMTKVTPSWKGAPQLEDKIGGWSFKPRGRLQYDLGHVSNPQDAIVSRNLGFNARARRIRIGAEGTLPGNFGYKVEVDFANNEIRFGDAVITYTPDDLPASLTLGNHFTFSGLEQITSSSFTSFLERAQMTEAFGGSRRLGASITAHDKLNVLRFSAGLFAAHSIDSGLDNEGWIAATRLTYAPELMGGRVHLGANFQHREFQSNNNQSPSNAVGAPSTNQIARYRARPFSQLTDQRFVDTGNFAAKGDDIYGIELGGLFKSLHFAGEA
ncbi:MAG TPA: porin, partial [Nitrospiraceae bacterium]|nr:porin [Nitrospiraceae bacterium]